MVVALLPGACRPKQASVGPPRVAVSIFPLYDIARRVAGDRLDVVLVLPPGRSEHSYDPTPKEMARVADSRLAISVGLGMDDWLERIIQGAAGSEVPSLQLGPRVQPRSMTQKEVGDEAADEARPAGSEEHHHGPEDPHFWLDPVRMRTAADAMVEAFDRLDPASTDGFRARGEAVKSSLTALDAAIGERAHKWSRHTIVTFHGSMGYYADRYGLAIAAVVEPFPGREPTPRYVHDVLAALATSGAAAMFSEPQLDRRPAQVIADQAHTPLFELDPVGGTEGVETYEKLLAHNTDILEQALK